MPTLEVSLQVTQDGVPMPDLSITRRLVVGSIVPFDVQVPLGGPTLLPGGTSPVQAAFVRPLTQPVVVSFTGDVQVNAGGFFLFFDGTSVTTITLANGSGSVTQVQGLEGRSA